jgi:hypothetical protein
MALPQRSSMCIGHRLNIADISVAYAFAIRDRIVAIAIGLDKEMPDKLHSGDSQHFPTGYVPSKDCYFVIDSDLTKWIEAIHWILLLGAFY